ncbi:MAG: bifunctional phosphoglucose/phosphomannose isomerase [candidate division Zixibacteria bacterium]|nr:bifunctional phosphoglucose/phosphomannose isomerase [candidate division Zixibacteria bacterium]
MDNLDNINTFKEYDKSDMLSNITRFPDQIRDAVKLGYSVDISKINANNIKCIVVCGMGGSAIGGELLGAYLQNKISIPFFINRSYSVPEYVDENSLVIASSYSGNTEEILTAFKEVLNRKSQIVVISSNGNLGADAARMDIPIITLPGGYMPRAALGFGFFPLMIILSRLGLFSIEKSELNSIADYLDRRTEQFIPESDDNLAVTVARGIHGKLPIIYGADAVFGAIAMRFKQQICENSKSLAFSNVFPEFNHNEIVGFEILPVHSNKIVVIMITDTDCHHRIKIRMKILSKYFNDKGIEVIYINSEGNSELEKMFSVIQIADYCSYYLAILNKTDPTPIESIDFLKNELDKAT